MLLRTVTKKFLKIGKCVDYKGISTSSEYKEFVNSTLLLHDVNLSELSETEIKVLFLNLYNALTIHSYVAKGIPLTATEKLNIINTVGYKIGKFVYSLNEMEHGILRGNRKPPAFYYFNPLISETDPRKKFVVTLDPRSKKKNNLQSSFCVSLWFKRLSSC
jgi:hypothetical protein